MYKLSLAILVLLLQQTFANAQNNKVFPNLSGQTLAEKKVTLPTDTKGKFSLIGMAYSKGAEDLVSTSIFYIYRKDKRFV